MKDSELRGRVLKFLYDRRREPYLEFGAGRQGEPIPDDIDEEDWFRACVQLVEQGLVKEECESVTDASTGKMFVMALRITAFGTEVIEGDARSPVAISIDQSQQISITGSQAFQIAGAGSKQQQTISEAFEKVINAIDGSAVSETEKKKAKSLLLELLRSSVVGAILGPAASYLIEKLSAK